MCKTFHYNIYTNSDGVHGSTTAPIAVDGHNTESVCNIVRQNDWSTCCTGGEQVETWTDCYSVVDWSPTIVLWGLPLYCKDNAVFAIVQNSGRGGPGRRRKTCSDNNITNCEISLRTALARHT